MSTRYKPPLRLSSYVLPALTLLAAAGLSVLAARAAVDRIEARAVEDVARVLSADGHDWVDVTVDGLQLTLSGTAQDEATRFRALTVAGTIVDTSRLIDSMSVAAAEAIQAPDFSIEILRNDDGIALFGLIPARADREALISQAERIEGVGEVTDLMESAEFRIPVGWRNAVEYSLIVLKELDSAKVSVMPGMVSVTATADSAERKIEVEKYLRGRTPDGVEVSLDISAPRQVIAPFTLRFVMDADGARFDACSADSPQTQARIFEAARAAGAEGELACTIGLGVPTTTWADAAEVSLAAVSELGGGTVTLSNADVTLIAPETTVEAEFDRVVGELDAALPEVFSLASVLPEPVKIDGSGDSLTTPEFVATRSPEGLLQMRGRLPDDLTRAAVESYAAAEFGADNIYPATRLDAELPEGWPVRVLAALEALGELNNGVVVVQPSYVELRGTTGNTEARANVARILSDRLGEGQDYNIEIAYEEALDPLAGLPTPQECVAAITEILSARKITFEPGSAEIDGASLETIDNIADVLRDCEGVPIEIGGHTDSQGRETMNQQLSQSRADAVLNAIMARRVLVGALSAKGYGETKPVADNGSEVGREANRRIEFKLIQPSLVGDIASDEEEGEVQ
ncbi:MAG: OmpA family protein [Rhodobacteraceae bacterium]|nr:OmpA family protein [Paracoccaceae bacterium]